MLGRLETAIYLVVGAAVLAISLYAGHLRHELAKVRHERDVAVAQSSINQASAEINDTRAANVGRARGHSEEARRAVQKAPDIDAALGEFGAGVDGVRAEGHRPVVAADRR